jgi:alpha-beta hydrolase superfamily lysophospholipase
MAVNAAIAHYDHCALRTHTVSYPLYFPPHDPKLFAWLHQPASGPTAEVGLLICKPFGYEAICAHRSLRAFADAAAAVGMPVLRFDYLGTGDSADADPRADQLDQWCGDIITGVTELRHRTGVKKVCLLGFRLGALLATLAAQRSNAIDFLILVAPVVSGRRYVGELRTTSLASAVSSNARHGTRTASADGSMEVSGHCASSATLAHLSQIDLAVTGAPAVSRMLIIDRDDLPTARKWSESLSGVGLAIEYAVLPGFVKMMMTSPPYTSISHEIISAVREWLLRLGTSQSETASVRPSASATGDLIISESVFLSIRDQDQSPEPAVTERPVKFGNVATLFGIVTEPHEGESRRRAVILVNAGADYHIAIGRMYVSLARCWARRGYMVLRMDLAGLGDSATRPDRPDNEVFPPAAVEDIRSAATFMRERYRAGDVTVAGLCSGAYHALQAAANAIPLNRILMVNPETFRWGEGMTLDDIDPAAVVKTGSVYGERVRSWKHWKKLLTGKADVWWIAKRFSLRVMLSLGVTMRGVLRLLNIRLRNDLGSELQRIAARGIQTTIVFSRGEPGIALFRMQAGSAIQRRLGDRFHMHIIDNADHTFSRSASRAELQEVLSGELFKRSGVA